MAGQDTPQYDDTRMVKFGVRLLTPETTTIFEGTFSLMHCAVKDDTLYRGVFAVMMFPITHPERYISLRYTDTKDKEQEIGIIVDLGVFPDAAQRLVHANLVKHYYEQIITRVYTVENKFGLLFFEVETQLGRKAFIMPWRGTARRTTAPTAKSCWTPSTIATSFRT